VGRRLPFTPGLLARQQAATGAKRSFKKAAMFAVNTIVNLQIEIMQTYLHSRKATRTARSVALMLLLTVPLFSYAADGADAASAASTFVKQRHLGNNLRSIAFLVASRTVTFAIVAKRIGVPDAQSLVREELDRLQPKYQENWDANLAASYAEFLSPDELMSLTNEGPLSPAAAKFSSVQSVVGRSMQSKSTSILQAFVSEALEDASKQSIQQTTSKPPG
jgi:hypothetical protein